MVARSSRRQSLCLIALCALPLTAIGADRCGKPPYGTSRQEYDLYQRTLGSVVPAPHIFPGICRAKFEDGDRSALNRLGITDHEIDTSTVGELAVEVIGALRARMQPPKAPRRDGIYEAFTCTKLTGRCSDDSSAYTFSSRRACEQYVNSVGLADPRKPVFMHCFFRANPWQP